MAPMDFFVKLRNTYFGHADKDRPVISPTTAAVLSVTCTLIYVVPFYLSSSTRPSPTLNRDAPSVIRARIRAVTLACIIASAATLYVLTRTAKLSLSEALHMLGCWPVRPLDLFKSLTLTFLLYIGPLFEKIFIERDLDDLLHRGIAATSETLSSWQGYRNFVAGPVTEEIIFRSVLVPIHLLAKVAPSKVVFLTPLYFGIAHIHHFYEFHLTHPHVSILPVLLRSLFQFTYTTLFGWFAAFIYLRTGSVYACIIIHSFCNWAGLPRFWGRVRRREEYPISPLAIRGKDDTDAVQAQGKGEKLGLRWTVAYYLLLVAGAFAFYRGLWPLTTSEAALSEFARNKRKT
ncbi:prenyl protein peptidase [Cladophialophora psammophila CBS 110553]|uniref:intramembrane prenyl-peptidase Rce1 n=1 Tax=Cladophialophora psammophila CBS 110553 TaxID=1182543 RepID=W9WXE0_9EURO|nr:prenyl protein peptidase [Cladophialophora psammophila CBS 110553]EXJ69740.1 prenyl protein peptidase [Cladophialophora psammophila CBS 110553]